MNFLMIFAISLLVGLVATKDTSTDESYLSSELYTDRLTIYTAKHDIYNLAIQINKIDEIYDVTVDRNETSLEDNTEDTEEDEDHFISKIESSFSQYNSEHEDNKLFFVEVDADQYGKRYYRGLYVLQNEIVATKLLENGIDTTIATDGSEAVYFAATDGLYKYNADENKAEKYGTLTDKFIDISINNRSDVLFAINDKFEMFKITDEGTKKEKIDEVINAQQLTLDSSNNIYYYDKSKVTYVINGEGKTKISGLPKNPSFIQLLDPPYYLKDQVLVIVDSMIYVINAEGQSKLYKNLGFIRPTTFAVKSHVSRYFAYDKKIYDIALIVLHKVRKSLMKSFRRLARVFDLV